MNYLITNALVVPMTKKDFFLPKADIGIASGKIAFVGKAPAGFKADKTINAEGMIAMPSLVNTHTHLAMELERNYKDDLPNLESWLGEIFPIEAKLTRDDIYWASKLGLCELIQSGCTLFNDMYYQIDQTAKACEETGIRALLGMTMVGDEKTQIENLPRQYESVLPYLERSEGRIHAAPAPHAVYTCSEGIYKAAHDFAKAHGIVLHTHLSETTTENANCIKTHGKSPLQWLKSIGYFEGTHHILAHCVHLSDEDVQDLKSLDAMVATNPTSNAKLASGMAPIGRYRKEGISVGIGTDGSSSNNNLNMFEEMHVASLISTALTGDITALPAYDVLAMATVEGAVGLGFPMIGTLQAGKEADLILVDARVPHMTPLNNPFSALVYSAQASDVDTVFCQGRMLMEGRKLLTLDKDEIMRQVDEHWQALLQR